MIGHVCELTFDEARPFVRRWHYSRDLPKGSHTFFGWVIEGDLYAVADYGNGVNPHQASYLTKVLLRPVTNDSYVELKRLCRVEPKRDDAPLTALLARCHRMLRRRGVVAVVSFSDPAHGHTGGIYRAANFRHEGQTQAEWHVVLPDGSTGHRRMAYRHARRHGISIAAARDALGLRRVKTQPKDRWVLALR